MGFGLIIDGLVDNISVYLLHQVNRKLNLMHGETGMNLIASLFDEDQFLFWWDNGGDLGRGLV